MTAIGNDAATENDTDNDLGPLNENEAAEELLRRFMPDEGKDAEKPSEKKTPDEEPKRDADPEPTDDADEAPAEKPEAEGDDAAAEGDGAKGAFVKIKVGDEEHEVPVEKLTRLYGQEAALTKKSMEVAEQRKAAEADLAKQTAATAALLERARSRYEPYSKLDFHLLATQLEASDYTALRQSAQAAWEDVQFLEHHVDGFMSAVKEKQNADLVTRAQECLKTLSGPADKGGIEGWSEKVYDEVRAYAITEGAPKDTINQLVEPWAIKMIHSAMLYARGRDKAQVVTKKVNKTPTKIVKTTSSPTSSERGSADASKKAFSKLQESGQTDDAAEALIARWARDKD
jgi:hypothetical protein